ncbi:MAG: ABC transporter substrate-binding protein/permease [Akkermansia sp.]|nr:ABC transporter substrate-binding protein/permease [Akkermansia sp.]
MPGIIYKKWLAVMLAFMALFLTSCGEKEAERGKLIMVTNATFPPYEFYQGSRIVGIDADMVREIAKRNDLELVIEDMAFDSVIAAVQTGKADVAASGITVTEDRKKQIDFTTSYVKADQVIIVRKDSDIVGPESMRGKRIGVQHGTTGDMYVTENLQEPERFQDGALAVASLVTGKIHAVVLDSAPAEEHVARNKGIRILPMALVSEEYAMAISKSRPELLAMFNRTMAEMKVDGTMDAIWARYLDKDGKPLAVPAVEAEEDKGMWARLADSFEVNFVKDDRWHYLVDGFLVTIEISACAVLMGLCIGFLVAVVRSAHDQTGRYKVLNFLCHIYLTVVRGTPVVVQLLIIYFVIFGSVDVSKVLVAIVAFGVNSGAYVAEIIRSGIMAVDSGQMEAGRSLGLSYGTTMRSVILPQAFKNVLPALGNEFIVLLKETSVCGYIALQDLTKGGDIIRSQTYDAFLPLIAVALTYLVVVVCLSQLLKKLENSLKKNER